MHNTSEVVTDTINSVLTYVTQDVLVVVDGACLDTISLKVPSIKGLHHNWGQSPYRNIALGLKELALLYPHADWYHYLEYDCLIGSDEFKDYLSNTNAWCVGTNGNQSTCKLSLIDKMLNIKIEKTQYLLGCCIFYKNTFIKKLLEVDFFNKFLYWTNCFSNGFFPNYTKHDISEHLYPTLAQYYGGEILQLSWYRDASWGWQDKAGMWKGQFNAGQWDGEFKKFPIRYRPELDPDKETFYKEASIMHPVKDYNSPIRIFHRNCRNNMGFD